MDVLTSLEVDDSLLVVVDSEEPLVVEGVSSLLVVSLFEVDGCSVLYEYGSLLLPKIENSHAVKVSKAVVTSPNSNFFFII